MSNDYDSTTLEYKIVGMLKKVLSPNFVRSIVSHGYDQYIEKKFAELNFIHERVAQEWMDFVNPYLGTAVLFKSQGAIRQYAIERLPKQKGLLIELGVGWFESIRLFSNYLMQHEPESVIYGFDTFEGLPDDWAGTASVAGSFKTPIPEDLNKNIQLTKGLVEDTLGPFLKKKSEPIRFIHMDLDLYAPTAHALSLLTDHIKPEALILFDNIHGYLGWKHGEYKAWREFEEKNADNFTFQYLGFAYGQMLVRAKSSL